MSKVGKCVLGVRVGKTSCSLCLQGVRFVACWSLRETFLELVTTYLVT